MKARLRLASAAGILMLVSVPALWAEAPTRSLIPLPRAGEPVPGGVVQVTVSTATQSAPRVSMRPLTRGTFTARPVRTAVAEPAAAPPPAATPAATAPEAQAAEPRRQTGLFAAAANLLNISPRPEGRPDDLEQRTRATAARLTPGRVTQPGTRGTLCGTPGLEGDRLDPIVGRLSGCGITEPVRLRSVDGVALTTPATINCDTARAVQTWLRDGVVPAVGRTGGGVANLRVAASYACRTRNHRAGARLSEHATGNAIDISGIGLADGTEISLPGDWGRGREGRILRDVHRAACGPFGTVLGPGSDGYHEDHFHFDVASYRSGPYCR